MAKPGKDGPRQSRYYLGFAFTALILAGLTLFLVLVVLPRRYVLSAGLRESGVSFPSEAAPFSPPEGQLTEAPPPPPPAPVVVSGPAELLWAAVEPLLAASLYGKAIPLFEAYLAVNPDDRDVLKEYAITLQRAGSNAEAVMVLDNLLSRENDPGIRLLLARGLRDRGRLNEASIHYGILLGESVDDRSLALEWGQALAWDEEYDRAAEVLDGALAQDSTSVELRIALAQVYYWSGELDAADQLLKEVNERTLAVSGGLPLKRDIIAALTPPEPVPDQVPVSEVPLSPWDRIALAQADENYQRAALLFEEVLLEIPEDTAAWRAYADLLQFGLDDLDGARSALLPIEAKGGADPALMFRLAQLDIWTGRNDQAVTRLQGLLIGAEQHATEGESAQTTPLELSEEAEVRALLGDLRRWGGDRAFSGETYQAALVADPANARALDGLVELEADLAEEIKELETPGLGGNAYSLADTDEFNRLDLGVEGKSIHDHWVWGFRTGTRWLGGIDLGGTRDKQQGLFLEMESARWWRWGTVRTGIHFGLEEVRPDGTDFSFGASLRFSDLGGFRTDLRYDHGPAYPLTMTLQSVYGTVTQDRITANLSRAVGRRWSLSLAGDAAWIQPGTVDSSGGDGSLRLEAGASLGRSITDELILGMNGRTVSYSAASPVLDDLRLFWDPKAVFSGGLYAQWDQDLAESWNLRARLNPSLAFIDERTQKGFESVPHFSAEAGVSYQTGRFRTNMDAFYYQGRFDGYRAYGLRFSVSARDWFRKEED